jgi:uncharacterized repeat protein (TIGR03943 family)
MTRFAGPIALLGTGVVIAKLLLTGQLHYYLSPSLDGLTALTGVILATMGGLELWRVLTREPPAGAPKPPRGRAVGPRAAADLEGVVSLGVVAVPLLAGLLVSPRALSAADLGDASASRLVVAFASGPSSPTPVPSPPAPRQPITDVGDLMGYLREAGEAGVGEHVRALGIVAHSADLPSNEFVLVRYAIVHCVADAQPVGLLIIAPDERALTSDQWVEVDGTLSSEPRSTDHVVAIRASQIIPAEEPREPYIAAF